MDIPALTLLFAILFPYPFTLAAKWSRRYDNRQGRVYLEQTTGWRRTCYWIHLNSLEAMPACGIAVLYSLFKGLSPPIFHALCLIWIASRILYVFCYLLNLATLRTLVWGAGYFTLLLMIFLSALR